MLEEKIKKCINISNEYRQKRISEFIFEKRKRFSFQKLAANYIDIFKGFCFLFKKKDKIIVIRILLGIVAFVLFNLIYAIAYIACFFYTFFILVFPFIYKKEERKLKKNFLLDYSIGNCHDFISLWNLKGLPLHNSFDENHLGFYEDTTSIIECILRWHKVFKEDDFAEQIYDKIKKERQETYAYGLANNIRFRVAPLFSILLKQINFPFSDILEKNNDVEKIFIRDMLNEENLMKQLNNKQTDKNILSNIQIQKIRKCIDIANEYLVEDGYKVKDYSLNECYDLISLWEKKGLPEQIHLNFGHQGGGFCGFDEKTSMECLIKWYEILTNNEISNNKQQFYLENYRGGLTSGCVATKKLLNEINFPLSEISGEKEDLNLRELLKQDFGFDFPISGGSGNSIDNTIVFEKAESNYDYVGYEYKILECLGRGRRIEWKRISQTLLNHDNRKIDKIKIETKETTDTEIITQIENYYFDITQCFDKDNGYNLIDKFFTDTSEYVKFLTSQKSVSIANNEGSCMATLSKEGDYYIYRLDWTKDGKYIGDCIMPFKATQENIDKFNQGCKIMAERLALYIESNNTKLIPTNPAAFGSLTYTKSLKTEEQQAKTETDEENKTSTFITANDEPQIVTHNCSPDRAGKEMTKEELHKFAVELLADLYTKAGMIMVNVNRNYDRKFPNLVMKSRNGKLYYVIIETTCYPNRAESLYSCDFSEMKEYANKHNATPVFAGMSFMNASREWDKLVCGDSYFVAYKGLESM
jgi:hypothetical protein